MNSSALIFIIKLIRHFAHEIALVWKYGYQAYHYSGIELELDHVRLTWVRASAEDFSISWDIFYYELTKKILRYPSVSIPILLLRENFASVLFLYKQFGWKYGCEVPANTREAQITFDDYQRQDLRPVLNLETINIKRVRCYDLKLPWLIRPSASIRNVMLQRVRVIKRKFENVPLPDVVILEEGRSRECRGLYAYARENGRTVQFSWRNPATIYYDDKQLMSAGNLDYPGLVYRPRYIPPSTSMLTEKLRFNESVLIVVPTFSSAERIQEWLHKALKIIEAPELRFSIHPSYGFIEEFLKEVAGADVDKNKLNYLDNYSVFVGCYSTLLWTAYKNNKTVYPIGFTRSQLSYMAASLSELTIYDAEMMFS